MKRKSGRKGINPLEITAVILVGGFGKRLRTVVPDTPKVLAHVCGRPFLSFQLDKINSTGIRDVILCTGYMAEMVESAFGNTYKSLRLTFSREDLPLGTGGALRLAYPLIKSKYVLVMNGDSFVNSDLTSFMDWFFDTEADAGLLLAHVSDTSRYGKVTVAEDGEILAFEEKDESCGKGWINAGIYIMKRRMVSSIPIGTPFSLEREFFPNLVGKGLYGFLFNGDFIDIGTPESYSLAQSFFHRINAGNDA